MKSNLSLRPGSDSRPDKAKAMAAVTKTGADEPMKRLPVDVPASVHKRLQMMKARSVKGVPVTSFVLEALMDLFEKYDKGRGDHVLED